eukprot:TRINITY_DN6070_c0_g1_i2.p1 TRINITY_DN6070_c0_g1~~TRINITY_DN6070_c0_g1_i2.p1  ORF type:complete len:1115 (+),score=353.00 TRINITY_DN6070_c0_g1_i2:112-3456(+)
MSSLEGTGVDLILPDILDLPDLDKAELHHYKETTASKRPKVEPSMESPLSAAPGTPSSPSIEYLQKSPRTLARNSANGLISTPPPEQWGKQTSAPTLRVLDTDIYPYPRYWVKKNHLRPQIVLAIDHYHSQNINNLIVMVVPIDAETNRPLGNARLEAAAQGIDEELSADSKRHGVLLVRFSEMKIIGDKTLGGKHGNDILLGFCLYSKNSFPPSVIHQIVHPQKIRVYNRFDELPAPNIVKAIPNRMMVNEVIEVCFYGQLFKKGKGTYCGITNLGNVGHLLSPTAMDDLVAPVVVPPHQAMEVFAENHSFKLPMQSPVEGFVLFNASNDQQRYGLGKLIYFQSQPSFVVNNDLLLGSGDGSFSRNSDGSGGNNQKPSGGGGGPSATAPGNFSLESSSYFGDFTQLQNQLAQGVNVNKPDPEGLTALFWASWRGHVKCVELLLEKGADVNAADFLKETPLHAACRQGHLEVVRLLLKNGADPELENRAGCTALHLAAGAGAVSIVKILAEVMDDIATVDNDKVTPLLYSILAGKDQTSELLISLYRQRGLSLDMQDNFGFTPLHWCAALQRLATAVTLIEGGAETNKSDSQDETPLFIAVRNSNETLVRLLLDFGAKSDVRNNEQQTCVSLATSQAIKEILRSRERVAVGNPVLVIQQSKMGGVKIQPIVNSPVVTAESRGDSVGNSEEISDLKKKNVELTRQLGELTAKMSSLMNSPQQVTSQNSPRQSNVAVISAHKKHDFGAYQNVGQPSPTQDRYRAEKNAEDSSESSSESEDDDLETVDVLIEGKGPVGSLRIPVGATLKQAREVLARSKLEIPSSFAFYFDKMKCNVEEWQEDKLRVSVCGIVLHSNSPPEISQVEEKVKKQNSPRQNSPRLSQSDSSVTPHQTIAAAHSSEVAKVLAEHSLEDERSVKWWFSQWTRSSEIEISDFVGALRDQFGSNSADIMSTGGSTGARLVDFGVKDFFEHGKKKIVNLTTYVQFLKLFGPVDKYQEKVFNVYSERAFHGFITFDQAQEKLKGIAGGYLIRYSQSLLNKGCFVLNVNKGQQGRDSIENYVIRYHPQWEKFVFYNKPYDSLHAFLADPIYASTLTNPIENKAFSDALQQQQTQMST